MSKTWINGPLIERLLDMKRKVMFRYLGVNTHSEAEMLLISKRPEIFDMVLIDYAEETEEIYLFLSKFVV